jgi:hypothetical protein
MTGRIQVTRSLSGGVAMRRHRAGVLGMGVVLPVMVTILAAAATPARASAPPTVQENMPSVVQFYQREVLAQDQACDEACNALVQDIKRPPSNPDGAGRVGGGLYQGATDDALAGARPILGTVAKFFTTAGLLVDKLLPVALQGLRRSPKPRHYPHVGPGPAG